MRDGEVHFGLAVGADMVGFGLIDRKWICCRRSTRHTKVDGAKSMGVLAMC